MRPFSHKNLIEWGGSTPSSNAWDILYAAPTGGSIPVFLFWFPKTDSLTLDGSDDIAGASCVWGSGWTLSEATYRPHYDGTDAIFDTATGEWMAITPPGATGVDDWIFLLIIDINSNANLSKRFDFETGRLFCGVSSDGDEVYYDGGYAGDSTNPTTGAQVLMNTMSNGAGRIDRTGVTLDSGLAYTQRALGGHAYLGRSYSVSTQRYDGKVRGFGCYRYRAAGDVALIMAAARSIRGL